MGSIPCSPILICVKNIHRLGNFRYQEFQEMFEARFSLLGSKPGAQDEPGGGQGNSSPSFRQGLFASDTGWGKENRQGVELLMPSGSGHRGHPPSWREFLPQNRLAPSRVSRGLDGARKERGGENQYALQLQYAPTALENAIGHRWIFPVEKTDIPLGERMRRVAGSRNDRHDERSGRSGIMVEDVPHGADAAEVFRLVRVVLEVFAEPHDEVVHGP